jgi:hypothetical protein
MGEMYTVPFKFSIITEDTTNLLAPPAWQAGKTRSGLGRYRKIDKSRQIFTYFFIKATKKP